MMETNGFNLLSAAIYLALILLAAILSVLGSIWIMTFLTRKSIQEKKEIVRRQNIGTAMVLGAFIWTIGHLCYETIQPIMNVWYVNYPAGISLKTGLLFFLGVIASLLVALVSGALAVYLALKLLMGITRDIDEWEEVRSGNIAVAVVIGVTVIVLGMFIETIISSACMAMFNSLKLI
jgi:pilus assembly protein TadC